MGKFISVPLTGEFVESTLIDTCAIQEISVSRGNTDPEIYLVNVKTTVGSYELNRSSTLESANFVVNALLDQSSNCGCCQNKCGG